VHACFYHKAVDQTCTITLHVNCMHLKLPMFDPQMQVVVEESVQGRLFTSDKRKYTRNWD